MAQAGNFEALAGPPAARELGGRKVPRAAIVEGASQLPWRHGFDEPAGSGIRLGDIGRHASWIFAREDAVDEDDALVAIRLMFDAEIDKATDSGTTSAVS